ncbi:hypothetical protein C7212DRAFT_318650 [Tuber magnatum]|uniref:Uncharacterized protein n=1 Tax=Tuber magnatum TaxID=42249 RepID=A0A317SQW7_9PEZI|nr:hypothetical protein C7212DRAFT_318650 [Tuber magnatum]
MSDETNSAEAMVMPDIQQLLDGPARPRSRLHALTRSLGFKKLARIFRVRKGKKLRVRNWQQDFFDLLVGDLEFQLFMVEVEQRDNNFGFGERFPQTNEHNPQISPGTLHQFQLMNLLIYDMQAHLTGGSVREPVSVAEKERIQVEGSFHDKNNRARAMNNQITVSTMALEPFYRADGELVPHFPRTGAEIGKLSSRAINKLLLAVGLPTDGALSDRKERFMKYIGFTMLQSY